MLVAAGSGLKFGRVGIVNITKAVCLRAVAQHFDNGLAHNLGGIACKQRCGGRPPQRTARSVQRIAVIAGLIANQHGHANAVQGQQRRKIALSVARKYQCGFTGIKPHAVFFKRNNASAGGGTAPPFSRAAVRLSAHRAFGRRFRRPGNRLAQGPLPLAVTVGQNGHGHILRAQARHHAAGLAAQLRAFILRHKACQQAEHKQPGPQAERYKQKSVLSLHGHPRGREARHAPVAV